MNEKQIAALKERAKSGDVYYRTADSIMLRVVGVKLDWIEPGLDGEAEPAALLENSVPAALYNTEETDFFVMQPLFVNAQAAPQGDLHSAIMNIPVKQDCLEASGHSLAYKLGHRDARHSAAELASEHLAATKGGAA
jgi:hypothetical protein